MQTDIEVVKAEVMPIPDQAKMIVVKDQESLKKANDFFIIIRALKKKIESVFGPMLKAAQVAKQKAEESRKTIALEWEKIEAPLNEAETYIGDQIVLYKKEQDKKRLEEEEIARQEAIKIEMERRKKEEEERIAQAAELEKAGATEEAEALVAETIEEAEKPVEIYIPPTETQKIKLEGATIKEYWHAEVVDLRALCRAVADGRPLAYIEPNMTALNAQARSLKGELHIPGVKAVSTSSMGATGRKAA
jgi:hypothetical protein